MLIYYLGIALKQARVYLEGDYSVSVVGSLGGGAVKDASPVWLTRQETSRSEE